MNKKEDYIGKPLKDFIADLEGDQTIRIGMKSAFVFIGNKQQYVNEFDVLEQTYLEHRIDYKEKLIKYLSHPTPIKFRQGMILKKNGKVDEKSINGMLKDLKKSYESRCKNIQNSYNALTRVIDEVEHFVSWKDRPIKDIYLSSENDDLIILVEGIEDGPYWNRAEMEKQQKPEQLIFDEAV